MQAITAAAIGLLFGTGIVISGMGNPTKVLNFFDISGHWDPSLAFVMMGALIVTTVGYRVVLARPAPLLAERFFLPTGSAVDARLIAGSAVFGIGWGIAGFCPGGALAVLGTGRAEPLLFTAGLLVGLLLARLALQATSNRPPPAATRLGANP